MIVALQLQEGHPYGRGVRPSGARSEMGPGDRPLFDTSP